MIAHYIILSLEFVVLQAPSFGLLKKYVDQNDQNVFRINKSISQLS